MGPWPESVSWKDAQSVLWPILCYPTTTPYHLLSGSIFRWCHFHKPCRVLVHVFLWSSALSNQFFCIHIRISYCVLATDYIRVMHTPVVGKNSNACHQNILVFVFFHSNREVFSAKTQKCFCRFTSKYISHNLSSVYLSSCLFAWADMETFLYCETKTEKPVTQMTTKYQGFLGPVSI